MNQRNSTTTVNTSITSTVNTRSSSTVDTLIQDGKKITEDHHKASILNDLFASVLVREDNSDSSVPHTNSCIDSRIFNFDITPEAVRKKLSNLKANKACGVDCIHVNVLKEVQIFVEKFVFTSGLEGR